MKQLGQFFDKITFREVISNIFNHNEPLNSHNNSNNTYVYNDYRTLNIISKQPRKINKAKKSLLEDKKL